MAYCMEVISHKLTIFGTNLHLKYDTKTGRRIKDMIEKVEKTNQLLAAGAMEKKQPTLKDMAMGKGTTDES